MGITGLIPFLEKATSKVQLKNLAGATVAVDSYCWLHRGVYACAEKLARGDDCDEYINFCLKYVEMLLSYNIKPIMVFDGQHLPAKALTEKRRRESRENSKKRAQELLRLGQIEEARSHLRRCVDVTYHMALRLIKECRLRNVDCIVAPYEADAQMAWLNKAGIAQYVITEDSDLTLFGARNIIFKLDLTGRGILVDCDKIYMAMGCCKERYSFEKFRRMCILSGCDYLDSLPGIGLAKSCKFMLKTEQEDMTIALKKIPQYLNMRNLQVDDDYIENFQKAEATFKHMYIFNPIKRQMERLNELDEFNTDEKYCSNAGKLLESNEQALHLALGNLNPFTLKQVDRWLPENNLTPPAPKHIKQSKHKSIWLVNNSNGISYNHHNIEKKPSSCALYFKKIEYISKKFESDEPPDQDPSSVENDKSTDADLISFYHQEIKEQSTSTGVKRKRGGSNDDDKGHQVSHNIFAKNSRPSSNDEKSSPVCVNDSLLKILSSKKIKKDVDSTNPSVVRSETEKIEVRSRFFVENVVLAEEAPRKSKALKTVEKTVDVSEEIKNLEALVQKDTEIQHLLYNSPSPKKIQKIDFKEESKSGTENHLNNSLEHNQLTLNIIGENCTSIEIDDDNDDVYDVITAKPIIAKQNTCRRTPSIGLSKSKTKSQKTTKLSQSGGSGSSLAQTRLSMFGFQKKPRLHH